MHGDFIIIIISIICSKKYNTYRTADLQRKHLVITMRIKHTIGYKVRIIWSAFYPYIFDSLDFRSCVKCPHFLVRKLPVDGPQVRKSAVRILPMPRICHTSNHLIDDMHN